MTESKDEGLEKEFTIEIALENFFMDSELKIQNVI